MPSFIIRGIDPDFWARVQAKAKREGVQVKALIVQLLTAWLGAVILVAAVLTVGCDAYQPPPLPSAPTTTTPGPQARLVLLAGSRSDQQLDVSAQVLDAKGLGIPSIDVAFSITGGTVTPAATKTDGNGIARAIAIASGTATLSATTGAIAQSLIVIGGAVPLSAILAVPSVVVGSASTLTAGITGSPIGGPFSYAWTFGDGKSDTSAANSITHAYPGIGNYSASVKVTDGAGRSATASATAVVTDVPVIVTPAPTPTPAKTLVVTLSCTPAASPGSSACNVTLAYGDTLSVTAITRIDWDWGDGTAVETGLPFSAASRTHSYAHPGVYTVITSVTAATSDGSKGPISASKPITVN